MVNETLLFCRDKTNRMFLCFSIFSTFVDPVALDEIKSWSSSKDGAHFCSLMFFRMK